MFGLTALELARIQFGFTVSFHIVFPAITIGLASYLAVLEGLWLWKGDTVYRDLYHFWSKIFAPRRPETDSPITEACRPCHRPPSLHVRVCSCNRVISGRSSESILRVVGTRDHIVDVRIEQHWNDRTELRFRNQACVVGDVPHDRRLNEVTLPIEALSTGTILPFRLASKR